MKYMKMAAIAMMALALFSCNKKDEPKKAENAVLRICINDAELRALGAGYNTDDKTECMTDVVLTLDNGVKITLEGNDLTKAKDLQKGYEKEVNFAVNTVALTANGTVDENTTITSLQGKDLKTQIPLEAKATAVTTTTENGQTVYSVTLSPVPHVARVEVFGKIEPKPNGDKNAFKSITVQQVYINNYLPTRAAAKRTLCLTNGKDGFKTAPETAMTDEIKATDLDEFVAGTKVAGYQLFPIKEGEATGTEFYDHVILKIKIEYSDAAIAAKPELKKMTERYVTMVKFVDATTASNPAIASFEAGKIYKLNLKDLSDDFKTGNDGTPDPHNPDTPDPEPNAKRLLNVKVESFTWKAVNIKPDVNGYKK